MHKLEKARKTLRSWITSACFAARPAVAKIADAVALQKRAHWCAVVLHARRFVLEKSANQDWLAFLASDAWVLFWTELLPVDHLAGSIGLKHTRSQGGFSYSQSNSHSFA